MALGHSSISETPLGAVPAGAAPGAYTLVADSDAYALTGAEATFLRSLSLSADSAAYALTGAAVTILRTLTGSSDAAVYTITGADAELTYTSESAGTYAGAFGGVPVANAVPWQKHKDWIAAVLVGSGIAR